MKSGRHALGTLGVVAAVRLFHAGGGRNGAFEWTERRTGFLIPVDSFLDLLEKPVVTQAKETQDSDRRRGDLIAMAVTMPGTGHPRLRIEAVVVECKFTNGVLDASYASDALGQAKRSMERLVSLCRAANNDDGMPERLALLQIVRFGLRISGGHEPDHVGRLQQERAIYEHVLRGEFELVPTKAEALLVSTELALPGSAEVATHGSGLWIRLNRQHWPGVAETSGVAAARDAVCNLFAKDDISGEVPPASSSRPRTTAPSARSDHAYYRAFNPCPGASSHSAFGTNALTIDTHGTGRTARRSPYQDPCRDG